MVTQIADVLNGIVPPPDQQSLTAGENSGTDAPNIFLEMMDCLAFLRHPQSKPTYTNLHIFKATSSWLSGPSIFTLIYNS